MSLPAFAATPIQLPKQPPLITSPYPSQSTSPNPNRYKKHSVSLKNGNKPIDPTVLWTSSISQRCRSGQLAQAVSQFIQMRRTGVVLIFQLKEHCLGLRFMLMCVNWA
ncbi:hypothetical protein M0R45_015863 [Rubus argutus]|uniref:Uncharacterized protein n=1 Tax=Rubus argutus TaxID=59490 RepID=A0AAW1XS01_RUBAR